MLYHLYIVLKEPKNESETKLGLSEQQLRERVLQPYEQGRAFIVNGRTIAPDNIEQIRVSRGTKPVEQLLARVEAEARASSVVFIGGGDMKSYSAFAACEDVTDEFILGPPGHKANSGEGTDGAAMCTSMKVFVAHGHEHSLKNGVGRFIEAAGLEAVILHERPDRGQTVIEKFEREAEVGFAVVLCTADDLAESQRILDNHDTAMNKTVLRQRARQNVIFELGFFVGSIGRARVALIVDSGVEMPSDLSGVIYINRANWQSELYKAFVDAGYSISQEQTRKAMAIQS